MEVATRMSRLGTESAFEVLAKAKELERNGVDIVHLEIGEPDFDTPRHIRDTAINAINDGETHYTPSAGIFEVRSRIAKYISETRQYRDNFRGQTNYFSYDACFSESWRRGTLSKSWISYIRIYDQFCWWKASSN